jgi:deoxyinosine 3'endonuclease (endonuclease V)
MLKDLKNEELIAKFNKIQENISAQIRTVDDFEPIRLVGGVDISFFKEDPTIAIGCLVVLDYPKFDLLYCETKLCTLDIPYVSGYLGIREAPCLISMLEELRNKSPELMPQVLFVDGNGVLHPRLCGLACHIGVEFNIPTIGVSKTFLHIEEHGISWDENRMKNNLKKKGDYATLVTKTGRALGVSLRTADNVVRPLFISPGHRMSLSTAVQLTLDCCKYVFFISNENISMFLLSHNMLCICIF